jgi:hypothetical protein
MPPLEPSTDHAPIHQGGRPLFTREDGLARNWWQCPACSSCCACLFAAIVCRGSGQQTASLLHR